jgi:hypothetical protein
MAHEADAPASAAKSLTGIRGERDFGRGSSWSRVIPTRPGFAVATDVGAGAPEGEDDYRLVAVVGELAPDVRRDPHQVMPGQDVRAISEDQREPPRKCQVDLFLMVVGVHTSALPGTEREKVQAEAGDAELASQALERATVRRRE